MSSSPLLDILRVLRRPGISTLERRRAQAALFELVRRPVSALALGKLGSRHDAEDVAQEVIVRVLSGAAAVRAEDERAAWAWVFVVTQNGIASFARRVRQRHQLHRDVDDLAHVVPERDDSPTARWATPHVVAEQVIDVAARAAHALIATGEPPGLRERARHLGVAAQPERLDRDVAIWRRLRVAGEDALLIGVTEGYDGPERRIRNRVAKQAQRGAAAVMLGARRAVDTERDPGCRTLLDNLAEALDARSEGEGSPAEAGRAGEGGTAPRGDRGQPELGGES